MPPMKSAAFFRCSVWQRVQMSLQHLSNLTTAGTLAGSNDSAQIVHSASTATFAGVAVDVVAAVVGVIEAMTPLQVEVIKFFV